MSGKFGELTVTDLARIARANARSVQHWAACGILIPVHGTDREGTGTRRLFSTDEAIIACVMRVLLERQMPVGAMLRVSAGIRSLLAGPIRQFLSEVISNEKRAWYVDLGGEGFSAGKFVFGGIVDFVSVFEKMNKASTALVIDLTAALSGIKGNIPGY